MFLANKLLDSIVEADLESLVSNQVRESKGVDYKEKLPGTNDEEKKEFLAYVSSFANAAGGDLIFGLSEQGVCLWLLLALALSMSMRLFSGLRTSFVMGSSLGFPA